MSELTHYNPEVSVYSPQNFEHSQRVAKALASSDLVPDSYRGNTANCLLALELSNRMQSSPFIIMQNVHMIKGNPSWKSPFIISMIQNSGRFKDIEYVYTDEGEKTVEYTVWVNQNGKKQPQTKTLKVKNLTCTFVAIDQNGKKIEGETISIEMAIKEGWYTKSGSKWPTMPRQMLAYRAASFFSRMYCPDLLMGMHTKEEVEEIRQEPETIDTEYTEASPIAKVIQNAEKSSPTPPKEEGPSYL